MTFDPIKDLPPECALNILSNLGQKDLGHCSQVCTQWEAFVSDNALWKPGVQQKFSQVQTVPSFKQLLKEVNAQQLQSNDEIVDRVQKFLDRVSLGQNARFRCIIGSGQGQKVLSIEIKGKKEGAVVLNNEFADPADGIYEFANPANNISDFNFIEDYYAPNGIGNEKLTNPTPPRYKPRWHLERSDEDLSQHPSFEVFRIATSARGPFLAIMRSPAYSNSPISLEIKNAMRIKLDKIAHQSFRETYPLYLAVAGAVLATALFAYRFIAKNNT